MQYTVKYDLPIRVRDGYTTVDQLQTPHIIAKFKRALSVWRNKNRAYKNSIRRGNQLEAEQRLETVHAIEDQMLVLKYEYMVRIAGMKDREFYKRLYELDPENIIDINAMSTDVPFVVAEYKGANKSPLPKLGSTPESFVVATTKNALCKNTALPQESPVSLSALRRTG